MSSEKLQSDKKIVTVTELCQILQLGRNTIYRLTRRKLIPAYKIGESYRYDLEAVLRATKYSRRGGARATG